MKKWHLSVPAACITLCLTVLVGGCHKPVTELTIIDEPQDHAMARRVNIGHSVEARQLECLIINNGWDVTFIIAGIHGDEPAGTALLRELSGFLQDHGEVMEGRRAILLPIANPDGLAEQQRLNANGVDLNRNFPAENRENDPEHGASALSEPEALAIDELITKYGPERIVSVHQWTETGPEALSARFPKGCIDYDGPGKGLAKQMAKHCDLPVKKLGARPGSLGAYGEETLEIPVITVELPAHAHLLDTYSLWEKYGMALVAAVVYPEVISR
ncbi:MAG: DUF2817 domain-containing protein [Planctomycetota bacterium]